MSSFWEYHVFYHQENIAQVPFARCMVQEELGENHDARHSLRVYGLGFRAQQIRV